MNATANLTDVLQDALHSAGGLVGVVDALLGVCLEQRLHLRWEADCCRVRSLKGMSGIEELSKPLTKSQFRAVLARLAVLCNERCPNSVSPYGGTGTLMIGEERKRAVRVLFVNTPDKQLLDIRPSSKKSKKLVKLIKDMLKPLNLHLQEVQEQVMRLEQRVAKLSSRVEGEFDASEIAAKNRVNKTASVDATIANELHPVTLKVVVPFFNETLWRNRSRQHDFDWGQSPWGKGGICGPDQVPELSIHQHSMFVRSEVTFPSHPPLAIYGPMVPNVSEAAIRWQRLVECFERACTHLSLERLELAQRRVELGVFPREVDNQVWLLKAKKEFELVQAEMEFQRRELEAQSELIKAKAELEEILARTRCEKVLARIQEAAARAGVSPEVALQHPQQLLEKSHAFSVDVKINLDGGLEIRLLDDAYPNPKD